MSLQPSAQRSLPDGFLFAPVPDEMVNEPTISGFALKTWAVLARFNLEAERCFPSHATIANRVGRSKSQVKVFLAELQAAGWLTIIPRTERTANGGVRHLSNGYQVHLLRTRHDNDNVGDGEPAHERGGDRRPTVGMPADQGSVDDPATNESNTNESKEPDSEIDASHSVQISAGFEQFWDSYPKKIASQQAEIAWKRALQQYPMEELLAGAERYASARQGQDPKFTMQAARWIREERWRDELATAASSSAWPTEPDDPEAWRVP